MKRPFVSIIIPTYNRPHQLVVCLQSLAQLNYPRDRYEVIVVDDGSAVNLPPVIARFYDRFEITVLTQSHAGPATARNTGAARARGSILAFTGDDCTPAPDWLKAVEARCAEAPDCALGGKVLNPLLDNSYSIATQLLVEYLYSYYNAHPDEARFFTPNNLALPAERFQKMGGFDPAFVMGTGEDRDFCDRWLRHGYRMVYAPEVVVYHTHELTLRSFWWQHFRYGCGSLRYRVKRAQRQMGHIELEPLRFYVDLLRYPFSRLRLRNRFWLVGLLGVSQVANATGFLWERVKWRPRFGKRGVSSNRHETVA